VVFFGEPITNYRGQVPGTAPTADPRDRIGSARRTVPEFLEEFFPCVSNKQNPMVRKSTICPPRKRNFLLAVRSPDLLLAATRGIQPLFGELCQRASAQLSERTNALLETGGRGTTPLQRRDVQLFVHLLVLTDAPIVSTWLDANCHQ